MEYIYLLEGTKTVNADDARQMAFFGTGGNQTYDLFANYHQS